MKYAVDVFAPPKDGAAFEQAVRAEVRKQLEDRRKLEVSWRAPTDVDRLEAAFAALEAQGIFARIKLADCQTCALGEVESVFKDAATNRGSADLEEAALYQGTQQSLSAL